MIQEYRIIQNPFLGAHALWEFVKHYQHHNAKGAPYPILFTVLPICFNTSLSKLIEKRSLDKSSISRVIMEDTSVFRGVQDRMESMFVETNQAILIACASKLITIDENANVQYILGKRQKTLIKPTTYNAPYNRIINTSKRLGSWFGQMTEEEIFITLKITF